MIDASRTPLRSGIILAAGEGRRLRPFIHRLREDELPKQFVNFIGSRSMLEHTFCRVERLVPPEYLFTVVSRGHVAHPEVRRQLSSRPGGTVVVQPENRETGPGLLLPLMQLYARYPDSTVVVFPSDHFILEEDLFMSYADLAARVVERYSSDLVLLGSEPNEAETEYGYILPGEQNHRAPVREVVGFLEKPEPRDARELIQKGALWNTMVMAFKARTVLDLVRRLVPGLHAAFQLIKSALGTRAEEHVVREAYRHMEAVNFSRGILEVFPRSASRLWVLPVRGVLWSDWGSEDRVVSVLERVGYAGRLNRPAEEKSPKICDRQTARIRSLRCGKFKF